MPFPSSPHQSVPPLESGDRLSRSEFEQRYHAMPHQHKAELIEGRVYMPSPLRFEPHAEPHAHLMGWLWTYTVATPHVRLGDNPTVRLDWANEPQPDAVLLIEAQAGGQTRFSADGYIEGAPELVVEIAASSAAIDLQEKQQVDQRNGVQESLVWQVFEQEIAWFRLAEDRYVPLVPDADGVRRSQVFPGLWLAEQALLTGHLAEVLRVLQEGLADPNHRVFCEQLATIANAAQ